MLTIQSSTYKSYTVESVVCFNPLSSNFNDQSKVTLITYHSGISLLFSKQYIPSVWASLSMVNMAIAGYRLGNTDGASTDCGHFTTYFNTLVTYLVEEAKEAYMYLSE